MAKGGVRTSLVGWAASPAAPFVRRTPTTSTTPTGRQGNVAPAIRPTYSDRASAGYSPDRVDALVWALTDLLVEPMPSAGIFEYYRERAEALQRAKQPAPPPPPVYAIGSLEWQRQQEQARAH
jgi:hypothetical protein